MPKGRPVKPKHILVPEYMIFLKYISLNGKYVDVYKTLKDTEIPRHRFLEFKDKLLEYGIIDFKEDNAAVSYFLTEKGQEFVLGIDFLFEKLNVNIQEFIIDRKDGEETL